MKKIIFEETNGKRNDVLTHTFETITPKRGLLVVVFSSTKKFLVVVN